jgi:hypothetical protein
MGDPYPELRGAIYARYKSQKAFAQAIGWSRKRLHDVLSGRTAMRREDIRTIGLLLEIPDDRLDRFFSLDE